MGEFWDIDCEKVKSSNSSLSDGNSTLSDKSLILRKALGHLRLSKLPSRFA